MVNAVRLYFGEGVGIERSPIVETAQFTFNKVLLSERPIAAPRPYRPAKTDCSV
jgi:hypothetical protein